ncbi:hypothetical protein ACFQFC_18980 [Amorphoplanes digitatis]|uniref:Uncharacterized protein YukE n=1 Tax=Actinoplanes digitatis TaxID=1868 RepID=A0A7W7I4H7_9ACTN|nr:hypothetical protein [Actinoplanes digitatis]MBB4766302.1 uncharacterized protein YukE [Actinoplanes digitatis]GID98207.1 hypothetical protein Adi01nite_76190 [Actinoplanes digitatis]
MRPPLVAAANSGAATDPLAGVWIAEDIETILAGVKNGSWVDVTLGAVSAGLDALALISDPIGGLLQYGVAWIIEHVKPLSEALDWLAGDPGQIAAHAQTWRNVAGALNNRSADLARAVRWDTSEWQGSAAAAYRTWAGQQKDAVAALAGAAETMAAITESAGMLVAGVRLMVRDAIAVLVSRLISYAAEEVFSLGLATPLVVEQVSTLCASWGARIAGWLRGLVRSLEHLRGLTGKLGSAIEAIKRLLTRLHRGRGGGPTTPSGKPDPGRSPRGRRTDAHPTKKKDGPLRRENESADALSRHGYDVEQNPPPKPNGKEPDYKIEGEYFDNYAPSSKDLDNIRDQVSGKVKDGQADRIVLNLDDCPRSMEEIRDVMERKPIAGLKEVLVVKDGNVVPFYPFS